MITPSPHHPIAPLSRAFILETYPLKGFWGFLQGGFSEERRLLCSIERLL
jgi:hypothetical protein